MLDISHLDISGNDFNEAQNKKISFNFVKFLISHLDISGKDINDLHPLNIPSISLTLDKFQFYISGKLVNSEL